MAETGSTCNMHVLVLFIVVILQIIGGFSQDKYKEDVHDVNGAKEGKIFRRQKINLLWEKAQKKLTEKDLKNLYVDLKNQDKAEIAFKKRKANGEDEDGMLEAELRIKLKTIMEKYNLYDGVGKYLFGDDDASASMPEDTKRHLPKSHNSVMDKQPSSPKFDHGFQDKKLQKLWKKIKKAGTFTEEEMQTLHDEFQHHQDKVDEYYSLRDDIEDKNMQDNNKVLHVDFDETNELTLKDKYAALKQKNRILSENFARLNELSDTLSSDDTDTYGGSKFTHPKVFDLWNLAAEKGNFSKVELLSIKEELKHFEHKLDKLAYMTDEANTENVKQKQESSGGKTKQQQKVDDYKRKVDKLHRHLESKIGRSHSLDEL